MNVRGYGEGEREYLEALSLTQELKDELRKRHIDKNCPSV